MGPQINFIPCLFSITLSRIVNKLITNNETRDDNRSLKKQELIGHGLMKKVNLYFIFSEKLIFRGKCH